MAHDTARSTEPVEVEVERGVTLRVHVDGDPDGPVVVALHGFIADARTWDAVVGPLVDGGHRIIRPDLRGHGSSTSPGVESAYSFDRLVDDVVAVLDALDLDRIHLVGHSMGGFVALQLALDHPRRVRSLVLVDCAPAPARARSPEPGRVRRFVVYRLGFARLTRLTAPLVARLPLPALRAAAPEHRITADEMVRAAEATDPAAIVALGAELSGHVDLRPRLGELAVPTTVVVGAAEVPAIRTGTAALAGGIDGARLVEVADAGHSPPTENPAAFAEVLVDHLRRTEGGGHGSSSAAT